MTGHANCVRADAQGTGSARTWHCRNCDHLLARMTASGIEVLPPLLPLQARRDGLIAFGVPQAVVASGRQPEGDDGTTWGQLRRLPLYVYCPRPGVCGLGQHLH